MSVIAIVAVKMRGKKKKEREWLFGTNEQLIIERKKNTNKKVINRKEIKSILNKRTIEKLVGTHDFFAIPFSYDAPGYSTRVNYYSSSNPVVKYNSISTGNSNNDNAALLISKRFLMSNVGNEALACSAAPTSKITF
jgi:hypothetical protein